MKNEIVNGRISLNGASLPLPCQQGSLVNILGEQSLAPLLALGNILCVWDALGIYARVGVFNLTATSLGIAFNPYNAEFIPTSFFQGHLIIDGFSYHSKLSRDAIQSAGYSADDDGKDFWSCESGSASLQVIFEDNVLRCVEIENYGEDL